MSGQANVAPIIIKKKKVSGGDGHHGGAWKVAYADFVTAMMAFFMLMWLLNATTEKQRKGIADYFSPTIAISRVSGGGEGSFGGDSVFSEQTLPQNGTGATLMRPTESNRARGLDASSTGDDSQDYEFQEMERALMGRGGESLVEENALEHIVTKVTDEGLVIELFSLEDAPLFDPETGGATPLLNDLARLIVGVTGAVTNPLAIEGHAATEPVVLAKSNVWEQSTRASSVMRDLLMSSGLEPKRIRRITGHADRENAVPNPMSARNNRLEVILLRTPN